MAGGPAYAACAFESSMYWISLRQVSQQVRFSKRMPDLEIDDLKAALQYAASTPDDGCVMDFEN